MSLSWQCDSTCNNFQCFVRLSFNLQILVWCNHDHRRFLDVHVKFGTQHNVILPSFEATLQGSLASVNMFFEIREETTWLIEPQKSRRLVPTKTSPSFLLSPNWQLPLYPSKVRYSNISAALVLIAGTPTNPTGTSTEIESKSHIENGGSFRYQWVQWRDLSQGHVSALHITTNDP